MEHLTNITKNATIKKAFLSFINNSIYISFDSHLLITCMLIFTKYFNKQNVNFIFIYILLVSNCINVSLSNLQKQD